MILILKKEQPSVINGDNVEEFLRYRDSGKSHRVHWCAKQRQKTYLKALIPKLQEKTQTDSSFVGKAAGRYPAIHRNKYGK